MPAPTPPELRQQAAAKAAEARQLFDLCQAESRNPTDEEEARYTTLATEEQNLLREAEKAERWKVVDSRFKSGPTSLGMVTAKDDPAPLPHNDPKNTRGEYHRYSLLAVLRHTGWPSKYPLEGLELEVHQEMDKDRSSNQIRKSRGVNVPLDLSFNPEVSRRFASQHGLRLPPAATINEQRAGFDTTAGAGSIPTIVDTTIIEYLRTRMVTRMLGARLMTDMQGLFAIPRQSGISTFYMVTQGGSITASNQTIDQVPFSPHTGGVYTTYTRQLLEQTNQNAEDFVREDQAAVVARGVETQMLNGQGSAGYPLGIMQNPLIGVIALGTNGAAPTWSSLVNLESAVAYFNADVGSMAYVTNAVTRGTLKTTAKIGSTYPIYLWNTEAPDFPVNGYPCGITNIIPSNISKGSTSGTLSAIVFGNWEDAIYAFWSGMDVIVDPYTSAAQGAVNIITLQDFDVNVRHYQSFCNILDVVTNQTIPAT